MRFLLITVVILFFQSNGFSQSQRELADSIFFKVGFPLFEKGKNEEALNYYLTAVDMDFNTGYRDYLKYYNIGVLYSHLDSIELSNNYLDTSVLVNPEFEHSYIQRGGNYMILGYPEKAILDFSKAIEENQKSVSRYNRGYCYFFIEDFQKADNDLEYYFNFIDSTHLSSVKFLIRTKAILGSDREAEFYLNKFEELGASKLDIIEAKIWIEGHKKEINKSEIKALINKLRYFSQDVYSYQKTIEKFERLIE